MIGNTENRSSIVSIEEQFQQLLNCLTQLQSRRLKLNYLCEFLSSLRVQNKVTLYQSYLQELFPYWVDNISDNSLIYRSIDFLEAVSQNTILISKAAKEYVSGKEFDQLQTRIRHSIGITYFYLGEWEKGLNTLFPNVDFNPVSDSFKGLVKTKDMSQLDCFNSLTGTAAVTVDKTGLSLQDVNVLHEMAGVWHQQIGNPACDKIWVLLVEQDSLMESSFQKSSSGRTIIGTIQPLAIRVSGRPRDTEDDLILFNNRPMSFNDLLFQQAQDAFVSARELPIVSSGMKNNHYKVVYSFPDKHSFYTGDSLGLAMGLLNGSSLTAISGEKYQYLLKQDFAVTGVLDILGNIRPISEPALQTKLETIFFSPFDKVVIPSKNKINAEKMVAGLAEKYPNRKLAIQPVETLRECFHNPAITIREKMPIANRVILRKKQKYTYGLAGILISFVLIVGGLWINRDVNPVKMEADGRFIRVYNKSGKELWNYAFGTTLSTTYYKKNPSASNHFLIEDLDRDGKNEIVLGGFSYKEKKLNGTVYYFAPDGKLIWKFQDHSKKVFGDELMDDYYTTNIILAHDFDHDGIKELLVVFNNYPWYPCRLVIMDLNKNILKEYWNSGYIDQVELVDIDYDGDKEILFTGTNNDYDQGVLGVLKYPYIYGHSPQDDSSYVPVGIPSGSQKYYLRFPWLGKFLELSDGNRSSASRIADLNNGMLRVVISSGLKKGGDIFYRLNYNMSFFDCIFGDGFLSYYYTTYGNQLFEDFPKDFIEEQFKRIEYWDGDRWTTKPVENKYWRVEKVKVEEGK